MTATILRRVHTPLLAATLLAGVPIVPPLDAATTPPETETRSRTVEVTVENEEMTVIVDGRKVPADRLRREPHGVIVLDEDGRPMEDLQILMPGGPGKPLHIPGLHGSGRVEQHEWVVVGPDGQAQVLGDDADLQWTPDAPPRAMLGIRMENAEKGVRVTEVLPGTPASKAGLKPGDIVLTSEKGVLTTDRLAEKIASFKPGQVVGMRVIRGDTVLDMKVELAAWDADLLDIERDAEEVEIDTDLDGDLPPEIRDLIRRAIGLGGEEMEIRVEVERDADAHHGGHGASDLHREMMDALLPHLEAMHREFGGHWEAVERELDHRMEDLARRWEAQVDSFAREVESQFREMHERGDRFGRGIEDAMRRRAEDGEQVARRIGEALRRSEEQRRMLEERVARLEAMIERLSRDRGGRPPRDAAPAPRDRPASPDRPRRRGDRGEGAATAPTSDA